MRLDSIFFTALLSILFFNSSTSHASENEDSTVAEAVSIQKGEPAPFTGTLLTNEAAATLLSEVSVCTERREFEVSFELEKASSVCELEKSLLQINLDSQKKMYENIIQSQDQQLDYILKTKNPAISKEAAFVIGVVSGVAITVASAYAISIPANSN